MKQQRSTAAVYRGFLILGIAFIAISLAVYRSFVGVGAALFIIGLTGMINKSVDRGGAGRDDAGPTGTH